MGVYPAWQSSRADLVDGLKEGGRGSSGSVRQQRFRKILVGAQVALSVTLLAGAALLILSFIRLSRQEAGFNPTNLWVTGITLPQAQYPDIGARARLVDQALAALRAVPGFESVSMSAGVPLTGFGATLYARGDRELPPVPQREGAPSNDITPGWFRTWSIPLLAGRDFTEHDIADRPQVVIISKSGARKVFGDENPIGKTLVVTALSVPCEIVGIVGDVRSQQLAQANDMEFYRPFAQESFPFASITVRSTMRPDAVTKLVQNALKTIDPGIALIQPQAMDNLVAQSLGQARLMMILLGCLCGGRIVARDRRHLRRRRLHRRATHRRNRRADGARRANRGRHAPRLATRDDARRLRSCRGIGGRARARPLAHDDVARSLAARSAPAWRDGGDSRTRRAARVSLPGAASDAAESGASVARRLAPRPLSRARQQARGKAVRQIFVAATFLLLTVYRSAGILLLQTIYTKHTMNDKKADLLQGTLDLLVLKALSLQPLHGLGVSNRINQITEGTFDVKPGSLFPALHQDGRSRLAEIRVGRIGEQPPRQVLQPDESRPPPARRRDGRLAAHLRWR